MLRKAFITLMASALSLLGQDAPPAPTSEPVPAANAPTVPQPGVLTAGPVFNIALEIDLTAQKAWVLQDGKRVYETAISSGKSGYETPAGDFTVLEKDKEHKSSLYGKIVDSRGRVLVPDASGDTAIPAGGKFVQAPMKYFLRFDGASGMHAGRLPGYPASHGCVRLPAAKAALFFDIAEVGMPVRVFGKAPSSGLAPAAKRPVKKAELVATPVPATPPPRKFPWFSSR